MGNYLLLDPDGRVNTVIVTNVAPDGSVTVSDELFQLVSQKPRAFRYLAETGAVEGVVEPPPPVPLVNEIHIAWFRAALAEANNLSAVNAAVSSLSPVKQALWEYATSIRIDDPDMVAVADALGINLRATFDRAAGIKAERQGQ